MNSSFISDIKFNCDVSDAQFWGYFSVCGLLMRYRDLYRSEKGLKPWAEINHAEIAAWISAKESRWPELEEEGFRPLTINDRTFGPFDVNEINRALSSRKLVYGAGYGMYMKPTFFLAELRSIREVSGLTIFTSGDEIVRDLFTSPGMLQQKTVFLRLEPLTMLLLYKFSELNTRKATVLEDAFAQYGFRHRQLIDETFEKRLTDLAERYSEILLLHEVAEAEEDSAEWKDILAMADDRKAELYLRAIKDLIADTSDHGPYRSIIGNRDRAALGLTIALTDGFRKVLYPEIRQAYDEFSRHEDWDIVEQTRMSGYERFRTQRDAIVDAYRNSGGKEDLNKKLRNMIG
jgi:hypothetical protein